MTSSVSAPDISPALINQVEDLLAVRWEASQSLTELYDRALSAFQTIFPAEEDRANISVEKKQAALVRLTTSLLESNQMVRELLGQDDALIPPLHGLGIDVPEFIAQRNQVPHLSQGSSTRP